MENKNETLPTDAAPEAVDKITAVIPQASTPPEPKNFARKVLLSLIVLVTVVNVVGAIFAKVSG